MSDANSLQNFLDVLLKYLPRHWPKAMMAFALSLMAVGLNAVSLGLFSGIPPMLMAQVGGPPPVMGDGGDGMIAVAMETFQAFTGGLAARWGLMAGLLAVCGLYLLANIALRVCQYMSDRLVIIGKNQMSAEVSKDLFRHLTRLPLGYFLRQKSADVAMRLVVDVQGVAEAVFEMTMALVTALPVLVFFISVIMLLNWKLALAAAVAFVFKGAITQRFGVNIRRLLTRLGSVKGLMIGTTTELVANIYVIKAFGAEQQMAEAFGGQVDQVRVTMGRRLQLERLEAMVQGILHTVITVTIVTFAATMIIGGQMDVTALVVFFVAMARVQEPLRRILTLTVNWHKARGGAVRVIELILEPASANVGIANCPRMEHGVTFENVEFAYEPGRPVLQEFNFTLHRGEVVAVVGRSGGGKTTLANLLLNYYSPSSGRVAIDGVDIRTFQESEYHRVFGVVPQDPMLFNMSIRDNIVIGLPPGSVSEDKLRWAAETAHVSEFVAEMPDGYDTIVGERGALLSGGQKQRVALARAIVRDPQVLLLDEATSSLDYVSEQLIQDALQRYLTGRTAFIIAHRLSTVHRADRIVVLKDGRIVEMGTYADLLARNGEFAAIHAAQFSQPVA